MAEMCAAEGFNDSYVGQVLPLAFLPPAVIESIPTCALLPYLTANRQISGGRLPATWSQQTLSETTVPSRQAPPSWRDAAADSSNQTREIRRNACGSINCDVRMLPKSRSTKRGRPYPIRPTIRRPPDG